MTAPPRRRHWMSRRSTVIFVIGLTWVLIGMGVAGEVNNELYGPPHFLIPAWVRALLWGLSGLNAIRAAITRKGKEEAIGLLLIPPMIRTFSYAWAWLMWIVPGGSMGHPSAWYFTAIHFSLCVAMWAVALIPPDPPGGFDE